MVVAGTQQAHRPRASGRIWASSLVTLLGCAPDREPEFGAFVARGEHVEVWASDGIEVCGGNVEHMDRFIDAFRELVGPRPEAEFHRYYVLDEEDFDGTFCGDTAAGCTANRRTVYAENAIPLVHELVHAELYGRRDSFLEEGIAVALGDPEIEGYPIRGTVEEGFDFTSYRLSYEYYDRAGHFTRFMIDSWGIGGFLEIYELTSAESDYDDVDRAFQSAVGTSLDEEVERYMEIPELCLQAGYRVPLLECDIDPSPWVDDGVFVGAFDLTCESPEVLGPFRGEIFTLNAFEVDELARYDIELDAPGADDARAWIVKCDSECAHLPREDREYPFEPAQTALEILAGQGVDQLLYPGKYWIRVARPAESPGPATLTVARVDQ